MSIPVVSIVGRPNVGKSSLSNVMYRSPVAIVDMTAGTTRDRVEVTMKHQRKQFRLVDTGGMGIVDRDDLADDVEKQIDVAIEESDLVLFVLDVRDGVTPHDRKIADELRSLDKPVVAVVNKCDTGAWEDQAGAFWGLGFGDPIAISAKEGFGRSELLGYVTSLLPRAHASEKVGKPPIKLAVVGKRNVGKSTLINKLFGADRLITSEVPGTTRDAVDVPFECGGRRFIGIDTAGMRKKRMVHENVDFYSFVRTERSIRRADVVILMLDAATDVSKVDKKLASFIEENHRPVLIVVNKWDLAEEKGVEPESYHHYVADFLPGLYYAPIAFMGARDGFNVEPTMKVVERLYEQTNKRVPTAEVNRVIQFALTRRHPPRRHNRTANVFYASQVDVAPPTFIVFVNDTVLFDANYIRYIENTFRTELPFGEIPVKVEFRARRRSPSKNLMGTKKPEHRFHKKTHEGRKKK